MVFLIPHFYRDRKAHLVELGVGFNHVFSQPSPLFLIALLIDATLMYHLCKGLIDGSMKGALMDELAHRVTHMYLFGKDDKPVHRTPPQNVFTLFVPIPGKELSFICCENIDVICLRLRASLVFM